MKRDLSKLFNEIVKAEKVSKQHTNTTFIYANKLRDFFELEKTEQGFATGKIIERTSSPYALTDGITISFKCDIACGPFGVNPRSNCKNSLFTNSMNGEALMDLFNSHKTLLKQAQFNYLFSYIGGNDNPTPYQLKPQDCYFEFLSWQQSKYSVCLPNVVPNYLAKYEYKKLLDASNIPEHLKGWITSKEYTEMTQETINALRESLSDASEIQARRYIPRVTLSKIDTLIELIKQKADANKLKLIVGAAGTGKSHSVVNALEPNAKNVIVSLSNTIGMMFKQKCSKFNKKIDSFSNTAALFALTNPRNRRHNDIMNADCIVIDEFSQWGVESLDLLILLLSMNTSAVFYIMGDVNQIPTFLSSGSLLYSLQSFLKEKYVDCFTELTEQKRYCDSPAYMELVRSMKDDFSVPLDTNIDTIKDHYFTICDCFITGANAHVKELNERAFAVKFGVPIDIVRKATGLSDKVKLVMKRSEPIKVIAINTKELMSLNGRVKILTNERFDVLSANYNAKNAVYDYTLQSSVTGNKITISERDLNYTFTLGYAITVNKAQGLDWDTVGVVLDPTLDLNLQNFNSLYVAATRGKDAMFFLQEPNKALSKALLNSYLSTKIRFFNFFKTK